ncbi:ROK family transcriptional regulator [Nakamurella antarctica]|uniref:ROK family transcriptional regulator n=1 Tax=Nakamurella antarctica TaxID=1902245 RepID=A0A3G8ZJS0_9ACTN|nr:ROK family transcriptional regulator [Nakamurella antarctica]AZI57602.1 ROK family transcriptional regulator [Nakamurella antarctica]
MTYQTRTPGSQASLREANRRRIVEALHKHGGLSKAELAGASGLSAGTVHNIVKELSSAGILHTVDATQSGRRAVFVTLARELGLVAGIHISRRHLRIVLSDVAKTVIAEHEMPLGKDHRADNELRKSLLLIADMLDAVGASSDELLGVGVAINAPVERHSGTVMAHGELRGWERVPIAEILQRGLGKPAWVANASNLAALAELRMGALRGTEHGIFIDINEGVGAGLIIDGRLFIGNSGTAGEFGHMTIRENGPKCSCGSRGCLDAVAGGGAVLERLKDTYRNLKLSDLLARAMAGDDACIRAIAEAGSSIGVAAVTMCMLINPARIVIGGEMSRAGELLLGPIRREVETSFLAGEGSTPEIIQAQVGIRAGVLGSILLAIDHIEIARSALRL